MTSNLSDFMKMAIIEATNGVLSGDGGPFGAVIVRRNLITNDWELLSQGHNMVLASHDPTAHAEITAIRLACTKLQCFHLHNCVLFTSCYPCPMCMGAALWAELEAVYYAADSTDASKAGFNDQPYHQFVGLQAAIDEEMSQRGESTSTDAVKSVKLRLERLKVEDYEKPFKVWKESGDVNKLY